MKRIKDAYFYKTYFGLFAVVALQSFLICAVNLADSMMLGKYSELAMSGVSLANQIQFFLFFIINGACNGLVVLGSQYWGKGDRAAIKKVFFAAFAVCCGIGAALEAVVLITPAGVLGLLSDEAEIVAAGAGPAPCAGGGRPGTRAPDSFYPRRTGGRRRWSNRAVRGRTRYRRGYSGDRRRRNERHTAGTRAWRGGRRNGEAYSGDGPDG